MVYKWEAALKQAGWEQASKTHNGTLLQKKKKKRDYKGSSEKKPVKVQSLISAMVCRGTSWKSQRTSISPEKHHLLSIILEKMPWLIPLPKCYTKHQFSSHFPFRKQTWIVFSCCFLTGQVISKRASELSAPIVMGHYLIALIHLAWPDVLSFPVHTIMSRRARIWGLEV